MQQKDRQKNEKIQRLQSQVQRQHAQVQELKAAQQREAARVVTLSNQLDQLESEKESFQDQLSAKERSFQEQLAAREKELLVKSKFFQDQLSAKEQELTALQHRVTALQQQTEGMAQERDALQLELVSLREGLQTKDAEIAVQRERVRKTEKEVKVKTAEITAKDALLQSKERRIQSLRREVESLRQRGTEQVTLLHPGGASLEWKPCTDLPVGMSHAQAVQLKTKVYVQGHTESHGTNCTIYTYEVFTDAWVSMKSPTMWSALTIYHSQLVLVGGVKSTTGRVTDQLRVLQGEHTWTQPLPPMPTARHSASAVSSGDHLVVAGGVNVDYSNANSVEVYDGVQWVRADPLPANCRDIKSIYHSGMWYLMGGSGQSTSVFYTSLRSLIEKATQQPPHSPNTSEQQQSVWKTLPDVVYEYSSTTTLGGALLTVGGRDSKGKRTSSMHMYSPLTNSWLHIGDMFEAVSSTCSITLTTGEAMIIGGRTDSWSGDWSSHVHKFTLKLQ